MNQRLMHCTAIIAKPGQSIDEVIVKARTAKGANVTITDRTLVRPETPIAAVRRGGSFDPMESALVCAANRAIRATLPGSSRAHVSGQPVFPCSAVCRHLPQRVVDNSCRVATIVTNTGAGCQRSNFHA